MGTYTGAALARHLDLTSLEVSDNAVNDMNLEFGGEGDVWFPVVAAPPATICEMCDPIDTESNQAAVVMIDAQSVLGPDAGHNTLYCEEHAYAGIFVYGDDWRVKA